MTRLAIQLSDPGRNDAFRAAASRIGPVELVEAEDAGFAESLVTDDKNLVQEGRPTLYVGGRYPGGAGVFPSFPWRFLPAVREIRRCLDQGQLGRPGLLRLHRWTPVSQPLVEEARLGAVDLALWLFGREPEVVHRTAHAPLFEILHLGFPGGGMALIDFTDRLPEGEGYFSLSLIGSRGAAYADDHRDRNLVFAGAAPTATLPETDHAFIQPMLEDFLAAIREGRDETQARRDHDKALSIIAT